VQFWFFYLIGFSFSSLVVFLKENETFTNKFLTKLLNRVFFFMEVTKVK